jgi:UDP-N-acetylglucosamine 1-carboxyvinyltransferase
MEAFEITGGAPLSGTIGVCGSKNAATPIIAASLLSEEPSVIQNVPRIEDVFRMLEIIESLGAEVVWEDEHTLRITPGALHPDALDQKKVKQIRSSILLLGPLAARCSHFTLERPGGCVIGARPVDTHLDAFKKLGVSIETGVEGYQVDASARRPGKVVLRECSVTATENALMLAAALPGESVIKIAACEPHVEDLCRFLTAMGAEIDGLGTHTLRVRGKERLSGARHALIPDANEAATFLILGVATRSPITVAGAREEHLDAVLEKLREFGADFTLEEDRITVVPAERLVAPVKIDTRTYPGIPTDVQGPFGVLATQAEGDTLVHDSLFEGRFSYVPELEKMGARALVLNPHQVVVHGRAPLRGTVIKSYDLRAGAALLIAALVARGTTIIEDIYQVDRGYEALETRLAALGARIRRIKRTL